jgi:hypothetical protein
VIAVGIYRLQEKSGNEAHAELMGQIEAQGELLNEFAKSNESSDEVPAPAPTPTDEAPTADQRASIESEFGIDSIEGAFDPAGSAGSVEASCRAPRESSRFSTNYACPVTKSHGTSQSFITRSRDRCFDPPIGA